MRKKYFLRVRFFLCGVLAGINGIGNSPLHIAVQLKDIGLIQMLLERKPNLNQKNKNTMTPLLICANENYLPGFQLLVDAGTFSPKSFPCFSHFDFSHFFSYIFLKGRILIIAIPIETLLLIFLLLKASKKFSLFCFPIKKSNLKKQITAIKHLFFLLLKILNMNAVNCF